jgi:hypothetical protein
LGRHKMELGAFYRPPITCLLLTGRCLDIAAWPCRRVTYDRGLNIDFVPRRILSRRTTGVTRRRRTRPPLSRTRPPLAFTPWFGGLRHVELRPVLRAAQARPGAVLPC